MNWRDPLSLSREEKFALAGAVLLFALHAATPLHAALEYRASAAVSQPWRLLTAHLVHLNWPHVLINAAAWVIVARLFSVELTIARQVLTLIVSGLAIGLALRLLWPTIEGYRGFSGTLHALFFFGAACWWLASVARPGERMFSKLWLPTVLLIGGWIKVLFEQPWDASMPYADWLGAGTVPQAHLVGAIIGSVLGAVFAPHDLKSQRHE